MPEVNLKVNRQQVGARVEARTLLSELLRDHLGLTGTHIGCDTSQCGACVVHLSRRSVKSCTVLALQADGCEVLTIEGLASSQEEKDGSDRLHPMQRAFRDYHALQCGFCTPGMIMSALELLQQNPNPCEQEVRAGLSGNFCRCTGYHNIVQAIMSLAGSRESDSSGTG